MRGFSSYAKIIYTLSHPITGEVVYIGSTQNLYTRLTRHVNDPSPTLKPWIDSLKARMLAPIIEELDRCNHGNDLEEYWINQFLTWGFPLFNKNSVIKRKCGYRKKGIQSRQHKISAEDIICWKRAKDRSDATVLSNSYGIPRSKLSQVFTTGYCSTEMYKTLDQYFKSK